MLGLVIHQTTSRSIWYRLETIFSMQSQARLLQYRRDLASASKTIQTMEKYTEEIQTIADNLATADHPLSEIDLVTYLLAGLGPEYDSVVTSLSVRDTPLTFDIVFSQLHSFDARHSSHHTSIDLGNPLAKTALKDHSTDNDKYHNHDRKQSYGFSQSNRGHFNTRGSHHHCGRNRGRQGRGRFTFGNRQSNNIVCQLCNIPGHLAWQCHRYGPKSTTTSQPGFTAYASYDASLDSTWYLDTGSTHHLTHDFGNLGLQASEYTGPDKIRVGSGQGLPIHHSGVRAVPTSDGLLLSQQHYIYAILKCTNMLGAKPVTSPMSASVTLSQFDKNLFSDVTLYRSTVGALQYLSLTRPDISFSVNMVYQFIHRPCENHWSAVKRILLYLKHTIHHGLLLRRSSSLHLRAYSDSDWAGCPDDR